MALPTRRTPLFPTRLYAGFFFVLALFVLGVVGFSSVEHESVLDAVLTTVSAISTVGYSPPHPLSTFGKLLAIGLIVGGLFGIALVISVLTEYFMEGRIYGAWERRNMERDIERLNNHFIISGFGRVGTEVARTLEQAGIPFLVLDKNEEVIENARRANYLWLNEDASHDDILVFAGIHRARGLVACADSDTQNVYVTLTARSLSPELFIVARAAYEDATPKLYKAGANRVVSPYVMVGRYMAQMAADPILADYHNLMFDGQQYDVGIQELRAEETPDIVGCTVRDLHNSRFGGAFVLAIDRDGKRIEQVGPDVVIEVRDRLLVVGSGEQLGKLSTIKR